MYGTDSGTSQHSDRRLGDHRHVDTDPVTLVYATGFENIGQFTDLLVQFTIADLAVFIGVVALPDKSRLITTALQMAVKAVVGDIEFAPLKPFDSAAIEIPLRDLIPRFEPGEKLVSLLGPETIRVVDRVLIHRLIFCSINMGLGSNLCHNGVNLNL